MSKYGIGQPVLREDAHLDVDRPAVIGGQRLHGVEKAHADRRIDLDLCDMGAIGVSRLRWCERVGGGETTPDVWTQRKSSE